MPNSLWCHGLRPTRLLCPCDFPGKDTGVGCHFLLRGSSQPMVVSTGLTQYDWCPCKKRSEHTHREDHVETSGKDHCLQVKENGLRMKPTLPTPWPWTSSLQNCKKINFYCRSHSACGTWYFVMASQVALVVKNMSVNAGDATDVGSIPGLGRSPGEGSGNPLEYSCLRNPMDREEPGRLVHGVTKSWTWLSAHTFIMVALD